MTDEVDDAKPAVLDFASDDSWICSSAKQESWELPSFAPKVERNAADPYMTLVGYFNSIRELGGALSLMYDDVPKRLAALARQDGRALRELLLIEELTSRGRPG